MRHGETLFNVRHKIQGWCDSPLTANGIAQAKLAGQYFRDQGIKFDHAFCSTAERTSDTLELVTANSMPYQRLKGLREWGFGVYEGQDEALNPQPPYGDYFKQFGGETQHEVEERIYGTVLNLMQQPENQTILAVSHGGACHNFLRRAVGSTTKLTHGVRNCTIFKYEFAADHFKLLDVIYPDLLS
ncbi:histidine phosphatase family protein [Lapidilactobacillus wuchangensis]|uniref:histidine phosphatase family protein n=1 Tax=Lapidilactobacillus wuchangensis TaxID=2486001 RepID=UPI0013DE3835|nr:histidine phosphatase family protein [Lapidilactobacillus wuchangensis]